MADGDPNALEAVEPTPARRTNLDLVNDCDNFPYPDTDPEAYTSHISTYYHLFIPPCQQPLGYLLPTVALTLKGIQGWTLNEKDRTLTLDLPTLPDPTPAEQEDATQDSTTKPDTPSSLPHPDRHEAARTALLQHTTSAMRATDHFAVLRKWRDELYPIYYRDPVTMQKTLLASIERAASPLLGIVTYGVHMTGYTEDEGGSVRIYVPRRATTKQTYPGLLDQTVAGGIATGEEAFESLARESAEEASLPEELIRRKAKAAGTVTYFHIRDQRAGGETGLLQPECQFVYDLDLTGEKDATSGEEIVPKSGDEEEVEGFEYLSIKEVREALAEGRFKPNCALVVLDFLVRHGVLTRENEEAYAEVVGRLHRRLEFPVL